MPVLGVRNPFKKSVVAQQDPRAAVNSAPNDVSSGIAPSHGSSAVSILSQKSKDEEPDTYKLCVVNDSGVYLPPSPPEKKSFWKRSDHSSTSIPNHREALKSADNDGGFAISRESFDSYRRSFDISARSPVTDSASARPSLDQRTSRTSLDAYTPSSQSFDFRRDSTSQLPAHTEADEPEFKDVDLHDTAQPKKRSFLSRFGGGDKTIEEEGHQKGHGRSRSGTLTWRKEANKEAEELGDIGGDKEMK